MGPQSYSYCLCLPRVPHCHRRSRRPRAPGPGVGTCAPHMMPPAVGHISPILILGHAALSRVLVWPCLREADAQRRRRKMTKMSHFAEINDRTEHEVPRVPRAVRDHGIVVARAICAYCMMHEADPMCYSHAAILARLRMGQMAWSLCPSFLAGPRPSVAGEPSLASMMPSTALLVGNALLSCRRMRSRATNSGASDDV